MKVKINNISRSLPATFTKLQRQIAICRIITVVNIYWLLIMWLSTRYCTITPSSLCIISIHFLYTCGLLILGKFGLVQLLEIETIIKVPILLVEKLACIMTEPVGLRLLIYAFYFRLSNFYWSFLLM